MNYFPFLFISRNDGHRIHKVGSLRTADSLRIRQDIHKDCNDRDRSDRSDGGGGGPDLADLPRVRKSVWRPILSYPSSK